MSRTTLVSSSVPDSLLLLWHPGSQCLRPGHVLCSFRYFLLKHKTERNWRQHGKDLSMHTIVTPRRTIQLPGRRPEVRRRQVREYIWRKGILSSTILWGMRCSFTQTTPTEELGGEDLQGTGGGSWKRHQREDPGCDKPWARWKRMKLLCRTHWRTVYNYRVSKVYPIPVYY